MKADHIVVHSFPVHEPSLGLGCVRLKPGSMSLLPLIRRELDEGCIDWKRVPLNLLRRRPLDFKGATCSIARRCNLAEKEGALTKLGKAFEQ